MTREEAHATLFKGQANVAKLAKKIGVSTEDLKDSFRDYAKAVPIDPDVWQGDILISWPWC